ncbi:hypothetical protein FDP41_005449 [Naegleria fowleri]|uniref:Exonuclease domain-containing protein n=1 Tax=Naegleria fowleri TaxID=5763 RepID=A0A6A5BPJ4_NAEFO|nr:uncharacterized protein FDP41_005449 [Naegleria fowleri]KAF0975455.1 hypothetical protein FDP41_005449 [Naegleria fowleri]
MTKKRSLPSWMITAKSEPTSSSNSVPPLLQPTSELEGESTSADSQKNVQNIQNIVEINNKNGNSDHHHAVHNNQDIHQNSSNTIISKSNRDQFSPFEMQKKRTLEQADLYRNSIRQNGEEPQIKFSKPTLSKDLIKEYFNFYTSCPRVIVLDCETSGFSKSDQVIELAAVELKHGIRTGKLFSSKIKLNDGVSIHEKAQQVHKISETDLLVHPPSSLILGEFLEFLREDVSSSALTTGIVAHNLKFDIRMITQDIEKYYGPNHVPLIFQDSSRQFCTMQFHKNARGKNASYDLDSACHYFGISRGERDEAHSALQDAEITAQLFLSLKEYVEWENEEPISISPHTRNYDNTVLESETNAVIQSETDVTKSQSLEEERSNSGVFNFFRKFFGNWY